MTGSSSGNPPLVVQNYYEARGQIGGIPTTMNPSNPIRATASRSFEYTWAAMIQRQLGCVEPASPSDYSPSVARPNASDREFHGKVSILCFYRRNLQQPYTVIEGCFYNGSRQATLSWPASIGVSPTINIGTWLCEASVSRSGYPASDPLLGTCAATTAQYPALDPIASFGNNPVKRIYRRSYSFHQVIEATQPQTDQNGRVYVQVTLARPRLVFLSGIRIH